MSKFCPALALVVTILWPSFFSAADETEWKPESEEAALQILRQCRQSLGKLSRFEIECLRSSLDRTFGTDHRAKVRVYSDLPTGYLIAIRPIDAKFMQTSQPNRYRVKSTRSETWLFANARLTVLDEKRRTYESVKIDGPDGFLGFLTDPRELVPPWLDCTVGWDELQSRFRIVSAASTTDLFFVEFAPLCKDPELPKSAGLRCGWQTPEDERLRGQQSIVIDRRTLHPVKWRRKCFPETEWRLVYTRFDLNPPKRELKVDLAGYKDAGARLKPAADPAPEQESKAPVPAVLLCGRLLFGLLF